MDGELQRLDQEITLELQRIDGNLGHCFGVITKQIIPKVMEYGVVCDQIMDSSQWLGTLCRHSGTVDLDTVSTGVHDIHTNSTAADNIATTAAAAAAAADTTTGGANADANAVDDIDTNENTQTRDDRYYDNEHEDGMTTTTTDNDDSVQRLKKRKVSLLIQERYGSSSSAMPSPERRPPGDVRGDEPSSSPAKDNVPVPGTVIHFSTK